MNDSAQEGKDKLLALSQDIEKQWKVAETIVGRYMRIPEYITANARLLSTLDPDLPAFDLPSAIHSSLTVNISRSGSYQAAFYFGGRNLYPSKLVGKSELTIRDMVNWFGAWESFAVVFLLYFNRYLQLRGSPELWNSWNPHFRRDIAIGREIGRIWPQIGPGRGMLWAGIRRVAEGFFLLSQPRNFVKLEKIGMMQRDFPEPEEEIAICGFSHLTVAGCLAQVCGLGVPIAAGFLTFGNEKLNLERPEEQPTKELLWLCEAFKKGQKAAELDAKSVLVAVEASSELDDFYERLQKNVGVYDWINSQKEDVGQIVAHKLVN